MVDDNKPAPTQSAGSGFFIVNHFDRPSEEHLAERRADGKFYYVHARLKNVKQYWGMTPTSPTPVEAFGIRVSVMDGMLFGVTDPNLEVTATYSDGRHRRWQGESRFQFRFEKIKITQPTNDTRTPTTSRE